MLCSVIQYALVLTYEVNAKLLSVRIDGDNQLQLLVCVMKISINKINSSKGALDTGNDKC